MQITLIDLYCFCKHKMALVDKIIALASGSASVLGEAMQRPRKETIARTYRLETALVRDLKQFQEELDLRSPETVIVQAAIREYIDRNREAKRSGARR